MAELSARPIGRLLREQQSAEPDALIEALSTAAEGIGGTNVVLYLIDYEHVDLVPHPAVDAEGESLAVVPVDGSMPGWAFQSATAVAVERDDGWRAWIPVRERANDLGVLAITVPGWDDDLEHFCTELGLAAGYLLMGSAQYTDLPHLLRRRRDMGLAAEMQWTLLPPLSFSSGGTGLAGLLEPAYEVGGDCFDYAINDGVLDFAVFDAMGHGLISAVLTSLLVGAYRHGRREGQDLAQLAESIDTATQAFPRKPMFATALLARLQIATGHLTWMTCGHPQPIIVRRETCLPGADMKPGAPLGLGALAPVAGDLVEVQLEPGDGVLLYTDGVTEARSPTGEYFGQPRLRDLLAREHLAGTPPQESIRRLVRSTLSHAGTRLRDDATMLYLRWNDPTVDR